jgi:hypothetical protein
MPSAEDASATADISEDAPQGEQDLAFVVSDEASAEADAPPVARDAADAGMADAAEAAEAQDAQPAATLAADDLPPPVDDPVFDDADDPMTTSAVDGDFAPGTPDIEIESRQID